MTTGTARDDTGRERERCEEGGCGETAFHAGYLHGGLEGQLRDACHARKQAPPATASV